MLRGQRGCSLQLDLSGILLLATKYSKHSMNFHPEQENRTAENMINITINNKSANMMDHIDALASIEFGDNYCTYCTGNY